MAAQGFVARQDGCFLCQKLIRMVSSDGWVSKPGVCLEN